MGLEPTRPQWPRDFKSLVSTDSTIQAHGYVVQRYNFLIKEVSFLTFFVPKSLGSRASPTSLASFLRLSVEGLLDQLKDAVDAAQAIDGAVLALLLIVSLQGRRLVVVSLQALAGCVLVVV